MCTPLTTTEVRVIYNASTVSLHVCPVSCVLEDTVCCGLLEQEMFAEKHFIKMRGIMGPDSEDVTFEDARQTDTRHDEKSSGRVWDGGEGRSSAEGTLRR